MSSIPDYNNFYGTLFKADINAVIKVFQSFDWHVTTSQWNNVKLKKHWGGIEMQLFESEVLLSGAVIYNELVVAEINKILQAAGTRAKWEFYTENKTLLDEGTV